MSRQAALTKSPQDSVAWRVIDFLQANPTEELTRHDVAAKYDIDPVQVDDKLRPAVNSGHLIREVNADSVLVWRLNYSKRGTPKPFAVSLAAAKKAARARRRSRVVIDFASLVIEEGLPVIENRPTRGGEWGALFGRMKAGDSVLFPVEAKDALSHAQFAYRSKNPGVMFVIRKIGTTHCRVWRTA